MKSSLAYMIDEWAQFDQTIVDADISHSVVVFSVYPGHTWSIIANNIWIEVIDLLFKVIILLNKAYFGLLCAN